MLKLGRFVFTKEETQVIIFVIAAFLLGLGAKYYRDNHPVPPTPEKAGKKSAAHTIARPRKSDRGSDR